jgi:thiosulfate reductase cytochrome b subunit
MANGIAASSEATELVPPASAPESSLRHPVWVRFSHWVGALSFIALAVTGFMILMVHPRLYWGDVGNDLTPALIELPISNNHRPEAWEQTVVFSGFGGEPVSANRTYEIFNLNGFARSLHFLRAWLLVAIGLIYLITGIVTGHVRRRVLPRSADLAPRSLLRDFTSHLRLQFDKTGGASAYGPLQRVAYALVLFGLVPFMVLTGLAMSPAVSAAYPFLQEIFGGHQSARTLHFFGFSALTLFLLVHLVMVVLTGFGRQMRGMIMGK